MTEIGFGTRLEMLLTEIGKEFNIEFTEFNTEDFQKGYGDGEWTYEVWQLREIHICLWNKHKYECRTVGITIYRDRDRAKLENDIRGAVAELLETKYE